MDIKKAIAVARAMKGKTQNFAHGGQVQPEAESSGGRCYACGGVVPEKMAEGGEVEVLDDEDMDPVPEPERTDDDRRQDFLKAYLINRKLRG